MNRGRKTVMTRFNDAPDIVDHTLPPNPGNGFLMRRGYTVVWCGWQADVPPTPGLMGLQAPEALGPERFVARPHSDSVSGQRNDTTASSFRPRTHAAPARRCRRGRSPAPGARPSQRPGHRNTSHGVVLRADGRRHGVELRSPARGFRARTHIPTGIYDAGQPYRRARLCRGARHRFLSETRRSARQPLRWPAGLRLRFRGLAERAVSAPDGLPWTGGGRGGTAGPGRRYPARGRRHARRVQPAFRSAVEGHLFHHSRDVSLHRHDANRPPDGPAGKPA